MVVDGWVPPAATVILTEFFGKRKQQFSNSSSLIILASLSSFGGTDKFIHVCRWMAQSVHPRFREGLRPVCRPEQRSEYRSPSGVVAAKVGVGDPSAGGILMIFQNQVHDRRKGVFDVTGAAEALSNNRRVGLLEPAEEGKTQQGLSWRLILSTSVFLSDAPFRTGSRISTSRFPAAVIRSPRWVSRRC